MISFCFLITNCSKNTIAPPPTVNLVSESSGTITLRAVGIGSTQNNAILNAETNVFDAILLRGLPENVPKIPLLGTNGEQLIRNNKDYFDQLYTGKRYETFIISSTPTTDLIGYSNGDKSITVDFQVNLKALKLDLQQNNIITEFGF